jgi:hypothetical protein
LAALQHGVERRLTGSGELNMLRRGLWAGLFAGALLVAGPSLAQACPSCKDANATSSHLPRAYQASILFMLAVPATLITSLGFGLHKLNKAQEEAVAAFEDGSVWTGEAAE